jgi:hypothetical protein
MIRTYTIFMIRALMKTFKRLRIEKGSIRIKMVGRNLLQLFVDFFGRLLAPLKGHSLLEKHGC